MLLGFTLIKAIPHGVKIGSHLDIQGTNQEF